MKPPWGCDGCRLAPVRCSRTPLGRLRSPRNTRWRAPKASLQAITRRPRPTPALHAQQGVWTPAPLALVCPGSPWRAPRAAPRQPRHLHPRLRARRALDARAGRLPRDLRLHPLQALPPARPRRGPLPRRARGRRRPRRPRRGAGERRPPHLRRAGGRHALRAAHPLRLPPAPRPARLPPGPALPRHPRDGGPGLPHRRGRARRHGGQPLPQRAGGPLQAPRLAHGQPAGPLLPGESRGATSTSASTSPTPPRGRRPARAPLHPPPAHLLAPLPQALRPRRSARPVRACHRGRGRRPHHPRRAPLAPDRARRRAGRRERALRLVPAPHGGPPFKRKHAGSATPLYLRFKGLVGY